MDDRMLAEALGALKCLGELDVSGCERLTDKSWVLLGKYRAQGPVWEEDEEDEEDEQSAAADFGGWQGWREFAAGGGPRGVATRGGGGGGGGSSGSSDGEGDASDAAGRLASLRLGRSSAGPDAAARGLRFVAVRGCRGLTDHGARQLLGGDGTRGSLQRLDVSRTAVTSAGLQLPPLGVLRVLSASHLRGLTQLALQLPASHPLESLDLSHCHHLRELTLFCPRLVKANLSACRTLFRLRVRCPRLESLSAPQCGGLQVLFADAWVAPRLRDLNFFGCRELRGDALAAVLPLSPGLQLLDLNGCWGVGELHLGACQELESLDVSGCRSLTALSCPSPALASLAASGCGRLAAITLAPARRMERLVLTNCQSLRDVFAAGAGAAAAGAGAAEAGQRRRGGGGGGGGGGVALGGCGALSDSARAQLRALVAAE